MQVSCGENGSVRLYCDGQPVIADQLPALSEIYVHAIPDEGYEVCPVEVNQQAMIGRAFLLAEDTQIDMRFRKRTVETFSVSLEYGSYIHHVDGGTVTVSVDRAAVEDTVNITAAICEGYTVAYLEVLSEESDGTLPLTRTDDGWQFVMPGEPVRVVTAIRPLYQPEISVCVNNAYGSLTAPQTAVEGQWISVQAHAHAASSLEALTLVYHRNGAEQRVDLLPALAAEQIYRFCVPAADALTLEAVFAQPPAYTVSEFLSEHGSVTASVSSSVPTEEVLLTVLPAEGYRLLVNTLAVQNLRDEQTVPLEDGDDRWSFRMPWSNVSISAVFEPIPPIAPGNGHIATAQQLLEALGGEENALVDPDSTTVHLLRSVEVQAPLVFVGGELVLDMGDSTLSAAPQLTQALVQVCGSAKLTIAASSGGVDARPASQTALLLSGDALTICGGSYRGDCALRMTAESELLLKGGSFYGESLALELLHPVEDFLDRHVTATHPETDEAFAAAELDLAAEVCFAQIIPAFGQQTVTAQPNGEGTFTLSVPVEHATEDALLLAALYGDDGRMIGVTQMPCVRGERVQTLTLECDGEPQFGTVFLLDSAAFAPLGCTISIEIP